MEQISKRFISGAFFVERGALSVERKLPDTQQESLNAQRSTLNKNRSTLNKNRSTLNKNRSTLNTQRSTNMFTYRNLKVYQNSQSLVIEIYKLLNKFPKEEKFALCDQLRRAVTSVPSNIAEGFGRFSKKEQLHFLEHSYGSLLETMCQIEIAHQLKYISDESFTAIESDVTVIAKQLSGLRKSIQNTTINDETKQ